MIIPSSYKMSIWSLMNFFILIKKVDDQMKLLQHAWSDLLILDHLHQRLHNHLPDESSLPNGQKFDLLSLSLLGCPSLADPLHDVTQRLTEIRFDVPDYVCLKFLLLLNSGSFITLSASPVHAETYVSPQSTPIYLLGLDYCLKSLFF